MAALSCHSSRTGQTRQGRELADARGVRIDATSTTLERVIPYMTRRTSAKTVSTGLYHVETTHGVQAHAQGGTRTHEIKQTSNATLRTLSRADKYGEQSRRAGKEPGCGRAGTRPD